jgi:hypothetical protein
MHTLFWRAMLCAAFVGVVLGIGMSIVSIWVLFVADPSQLAAGSLNRDSSPSEKTIALAVVGLATLVALGQLLFLRFARRRGWV